MKLKILEISEIANIFKRIDDFNILFEDVDIYLLKLKERLLKYTKEIRKDFNNYIIKTECYLEFIKKNKGYFRQQNEFFLLESNILYWCYKEDILDIKIAFSLGWLLESFMKEDDYNNTNNSNNSTNRSYNLVKLFKIFNLLNCNKLKIQKYPVYIKNIYGRPVYYIILEKPVSDLFKEGFVMKGVKKIYLFEKKIKGSTQTNQEILITSGFENIFKYLSIINEKFKKNIIFFFYYVYCLRKGWVDEKFFYDEQIQTQEFVKVFKEYYLAFIIYKAQKNKKNKKIKNIIFSLLS